MFNFGAMGSEIVRAECPECGLVNVRIESRLGRVQCIRCGHVFWKSAALPTSELKAGWRRQARRDF
ncbi:MAG TPA: hypothetical protein PLL20_19570 [Phycisphaerae bacterium]|nr:hypothetical protein [Phycisphaerae bacterium]HRR84728.1 hypothetical protein [Phycisphaerae bacterium]